MLPDIVRDLIDTNKDTYSAVDIYEAMLKEKMVTALESIAESLFIIERKLNDRL